MTANFDKTILIVEDETKLALVLAEYLQQAGFATHHLSDGLAVIPRVKARTPDLIVLDVMLPGRSGIELCRDIRQFSTVPIFMVTARVEEIDRLLGLELGADDYICKPCSPREVVARVRALFRRIEFQSQSDGPFVLDDERMEIRCQGQRLDLTPVEFRLLSVLLKHPGRVYSRDQLLGQLYEDHRIVTDRTVDSHIKNIRKKIALAVPGRELISSVYGVGYKLDLSGWL
ncbi:MAG: response regulator [Methylococcaceae bacterium]